MIAKPKNIIIDEMSLVTLDKDYYIDTICSSYNDENDIMKQFHVDLPRTEVYVNGELCRKGEDLIWKILDILEYNGKKKKKQLIRSPDFMSLQKLKKTEMRDVILFAMLIVCQTSFYVSYEFLFEKKNKYYGDDFHIVDNGDRKKVSIKIDDNDFTAIMESNYKLIRTNDFGEEEIIQIINSEFVFPRESDKCNIFYKVKE
jgi:hypothetical protein